VSLAVLSAVPRYEFLALIFGTGSISWNE